MFLKVGFQKNQIITKNMDSEIKEKKTFIDFLRSNLKILFGTGISLIIAISIFSWANYSSENKKDEISEDFIKAKLFLEQKENSKAASLLKEIIDKKDSVYSPLSLFLIIDKNIEEDENAISSYFDKILSIGEIKKEDLNLIRLKKAIFISNNGKEQEILELLNPIINSKSVWKKDSLSFLAEYYFSLKEFKKSKEYYLILLEDEGLNINREDF